MAFKFSGVYQHQQGEMVLRRIVGGSVQVLLAGALSLGQFAAAQAAAYPEVAYEFHSVVPLGVETFKLNTAKQTINLLASAESQQFEGIRLLGNGGSRVVLGPDGSQLRVYPRQVVFRVTATARGKSLDDKPFPVDANVDLNQYLLSLRFRLKVFRGLDFREVKPVRSEQVGVPADVTYDERIYQLVFDLDNVPVEERILLEVYDATGGRLTRFHLELM